MEFIKGKLLYHKSITRAGLGSDILFHRAYNHNETWILRLKANFEPRILYAELDYRIPYKAVGDIGPGIYKYTSADDSYSLFALTNGTKARYIMPCFDEPALKAKFDLKVIYAGSGEQYTAVSNMDVEKDVSLDDKFRATTFKQSPPMSTHNYGLVITTATHERIEVHPEGIGEPFDIRIHSNEDNTDHKVLNYIKDVMKYFAQYTKVAYPLTKLDLVSLPYMDKNAPSIGLGLGYIPELYLKSDNYSAKFTFEDKIKTLTPMLARIWFGNLVTPSWWSDYWLTEELSQFMAWKAMEAIMPDTFRAPSYEIYSRIERAREYERRNNPKPLVRSVGIFNTTDGLTVNGKGLALLMMAEERMGPHNLQTAISNYVNKYKHGSTTTSDLIAEMQAAFPNMHLKSMMESFTTKSGIPTVSLEKLEDRSYKIKLTSPDESQSWVVPVVMVMPNSSLTVWVEYPEHVFTNPGGEPIKLNFGGFGYYYTNYSESLWLSLAQELQENLSSMHHVDRIDLLKSVYHQISESSLRYDIAFEMFKFLENETDDLVWTDAIDVLEGTRHLMTGYARDGFNKFGQQLIKNYYGSIHWTKATLEKKIFNFACSCDLEECLTFAGELFADFDVEDKRDQSEEDSARIALAEKWLVDNGY